MVLKNKEKVTITSDDMTLTGFTVTDGGEEFEPEPVKLRKGPYNVHMSVVNTPSEFTVQQIKVEKRRPALLGPTNFADLQRVKLNGVNSMEKLRAI